MAVRSRLWTTIVVMLLAASLGLTACASTFYLVKDPESGREYYTTGLKRSESGISFIDGKTLATVTLQNSEIIEITKNQYVANTHKP